MSPPKRDPVLADMAVRVARAELERDAALEREQRAKDETAQMWRTWSAERSRDPEKMLDTLHIMGIPARDVKAMYEIEDTWRREGGTQSMLDWWRNNVNESSSQSASPEPSTVQSGNEAAR